MARRFFQYGMRSLMIAIAVLSICLAIYASQYHAHVADSRISELVKKSEGHVVWTPANAVHWFPRLQEVNLYGASLTNVRDARDLFEALSRSRGLSTLNLSGVDLRSSLAGEVRRIPNSRRLDVSYTELDDELFQQIIQMRSLEELAIEGHLLSAEQEQAIRSRTPSLKICPPFKDIPPKLKLFTKYSQDSLDKAMRDGKTSVVYVSGNADIIIVVHAFTIESTMQTSLKKSALQNVRLFYCDMGSGRACSIAGHSDLLLTQIVVVRPNGDSFVHDGTLQELAAILAGD